MQVLFSCLSRGDVRRHADKPGNIPSPVKHMPRAQIHPMHRPVLPETTAFDAEIRTCFHALPYRLAHAVPIVGVKACFEFGISERAAFGPAENRPSGGGCSKDGRRQIQRPLPEPTRSQRGPQTRLALVQFLHARTCFVLPIAASLRVRHHADECRRPKWTLEKHDVAQRLDERSGARLPGRRIAPLSENNEWKVGPRRLLCHPCGEGGEVRIAQCFFRHHGATHVIAQRSRKVSHVRADDRLRSRLAQQGRRGRSIASARRENQRGARISIGRGHRRSSRCPAADTPVRAVGVSPVSVSIDRSRLLDAVKERTTRNRQRDIGARRTAEAKSFDGFQGSAGNHGMSEFTKGQTHRGAFFVPDLFGRLMADFRRPSRSQPAAGK